MDIYSNVDTQVPKDSRSSDELSVNDLANDLTESLNIQGGPKLVSDSIKPFDVSGFKKEDQDMCEEPRQGQMTVVTFEKFLSKSSTFPCSSKIAISDGEIKEKEAANGVLEPKGHAKSVTPPCHRSISLPVSTFDYCSCSLHVLFSCIIVLVSLLSEYLLLFLNPGRIITLDLFLLSAYTRIYMENNIVNGTHAFTAYE